MGGEDHGLVGQAQQLVEDRIVLRARVAVLEVGPAGAPDEERVAGEHPVAHQEAVGVVGVAGRVEDVERHALDGQFVALLQPHRHHIDLAAFAHDGHAMGAITQCAEPGDMIGVQMGIDGLDQLEIKFVHELEVTVDLLQYGIDDQRLAPAPAGQEVGVGA